MCAKYGERLLKNNDYYDRFAASAASRSERRDFSRAVDQFCRRLDSTKTILDIGCGTGNHLALFQALGYRVLGVEPSAVSRSIAMQRGLPVIAGTFEELDELHLPEICGVWCAASLLHVPKEDLPGCLVKIRALLPEGGPLFITVRLGESQVWDSWDDESEDAKRFIQLYSEEFLDRAIADCSFRTVDKWIETSTWGRPHPWISSIAEKQIEESASPDIPISPS